MKKYQFKELVTLTITGTEGFYLSTEVDAREQQATATIQAQRRKIERLEKALGTIKDLSEGYIAALYKQINATARETFSNPQKVR